jgi:hypothetical protein
MWEEVVETMTDGRGEVVKVGEMVGDGCREQDGVFVTSHVESEGGSSDAPHL